MISAREFQFVQTTAFTPEDCGWYAASYHGELACAEDTNCSSINCQLTIVDVVIDGHCTSRQVCTINNDRSIEIVCDGQTKQALTRGCLPWLLTGNEDIDEVAACISEKCAAYGPIFRELLTARKRGADISDPAVVQLIREQAIPTTCGMREIIAKQKSCATNGPEDCAGGCVWEEGHQC